MNKLLKEKLYVLANTYQNAVEEKEKSLDKFIKLTNDCNILKREIDLINEEMLKDI